MYVRGHVYTSIYLNETNKISVCLNTCIYVDVCVCIYVYANSYKEDLCIDIYRYKERDVDA